MHVAIQTGVLIVASNVLGAKLRWCSFNASFVQGYAAVAIAEADTATFLA